MQRKTFISIMVAIVLLGIFAIWYFLFHDRVAPTVTPTNTTTNQNLFPFGEDSSSTVHTSSGQSGTMGTTVINETGSAVPATLIHITTTPVAGAIFLPEIKTSSSTIVRYIDRGTGHIYDYNIQEAAVTEVENTTMPKIYQGAFSPDGTRALFQSLDTTGAIQTISAAVGATTTPETPTTLSDIRYLPKNIVSLSVNPAGKLFYIENMTSGSLAYTSGVDGTKSQQLWSSPLKQLSASWNDPQSIFVYSNPSVNIPGYVLDIDSKSGSTVPIIDGVTGVAALENSKGDFVFGSETNNGSIQTFVLNVKNNTEIPLSIKTLADKCVWSVSSPYSVYCAVPESIGSNNMPDDWYQGTVPLSADDIWNIDATTGKATVTDFLSSQNATIDPENLFLDQNEQWIGFIDKTDLSLWALRISQ